MLYISCMDPALIARGTLFLAGQVKMQSCIWPLVE